MTKKRDKEISLSEKLSSLIQTKPSAIESDDDDLVTIEKITQNENDSEYSADELGVSKFRRINEGLLEEDDKKYSGKGVSRRDLEDSIDSDFTENEEDTHEETQESSLDESQTDHEIEEGDGSGSESEVQSSGNETNDNVKSTKGKNKEDNFSKELYYKAANDIEKGKAIKNQLHIWDFLLECRMKFQTSLVASNQFPNYKNFPKFKSRESPLFKDSVSDCKKSLKHLLNSLLTLQKVLLNSNDEFLSSITSTEKDYNDEEISSDTDKNEDIEKSDSFKRLKKLVDFSNEIRKMHVNFQNYRNNTIQKWNDKTSVGYISNKNFSAFEQSALKQIEHILLDKQRLIKRTQTKRSSYHILGDDEEPPVKKQAAQSVDDPLITSLDNKLKGLNKEIFDDDDFYHQLLNEIVKRKANDVTDPVQLGRQWMQLQKIRSKMKKTVDTKSSKGRKVRFVVHPKLVNFMMPIDNSNYSEESKAELFNSLFGKTKK